MSCCRSLYELDPFKGKAIADGEEETITMDDLTLINANRSAYKRCAYCGFETNEDFAFCPKCGKPFDDRI